jgi:uncharacterized protein GlcG (DUF336 family)
MSPTIPLHIANRMVASGRRMARERQLAPLSFCVLDRSGHIVTAQCEDGGTLLRFELAHGKAWGSLGMGHSTRYFKDVMVSRRPAMARALESVSNGRFVPEYGGVLVRDAAGDLLGAVGIAGAASDTDDEAVAVAVIREAGLEPDLS